MTHVMTHVSTTLLYGLISALRSAELLGLSRAQIACVLTGLRHAYLEYAAGVPAETSLSPTHLEIWCDEIRPWVSSALTELAVWDRDDANNRSLPSSIE